MISPNMKNDIMTYIASRCLKTSYTINDRYVIGDILKKSVNGSILSIYLTFGSNIVGTIANIKILDNSNNEILFDDRVFEKNSDDILTINLSINKMEVV